MMEEGFSAFLEKKKIDSVQFKRSDPGTWEDYRKDFTEMGEVSFDYSRKFQLNNLRKLYPLTSG